MELFLSVDPTLTETNFNSRNSPPQKTLGRMLTDSFSVGLTDERLVQRFVLFLLYFSLKGEQWGDQGGWAQQTNECGWSGVSCTFHSQEVLSVDVSGNNADGTIPPAIGLLGSMQSLRFGQNPVRGTLPSEIGSLAKLEELRGSYTLMSGMLPAEIGNLVSLTLIRLTGVGLSGPLPTQLGLLTNLRELELESNPGLSGSIPSALCNIGSLRPIVDCVVSCTCCALLGCTPSPTPVPTTPFPTPAPTTAAPTGAPTTPSPTTPSPTPAPTTAVPSGSPTGAPVPFTTDLKNLVLASSPNSDFSDALTAPSRALAWMLSDSYVTGGTRTDSQLIRRFAIASLYYSWNLESVLVLGQSECTFPRISCDSSDNMESMIIDDIGFDTTIPIEIGMLTELSEWDVTTFGTCCG